MQVSLVNRYRPCLGRKTQRLKHEKFYIIKNTIELR